MSIDIRNAQIGYCSNVHPGVSLEQVKKNLREYAVPVGRQVCPDGPMGIGLWLSESACGNLRDHVCLEDFGHWLADAQLIPFTFNGFPFGDFHQPVVKHSVYRPTWAEPARLAYTLQLADIQHHILPRGVDGSISTLPLAWPAQNVDESFFSACAENLRKCAAHLGRIADHSGRNICLCIEAEPGCVLDTCGDIVRFFKQYLLTGDDAVDQRILQHVGVCHDICHSAVMFEPQSEAISAYDDAGIKIGKVQVSSAIAAEFDDCDEKESSELLQELSHYAEERYLHQTTICMAERREFYEDLPLALGAVGKGAEGCWRVHFHVPIFAERLDRIGTTQPDIHECLVALAGTSSPIRHFEVETYAWNVLPATLRNNSLVADITREIIWFQDALRSCA